MSTGIHTWRRAIPLLLMGAASLGGCATIEGYQRRPETNQVVENKRVLFFGPQAEGEYDRTHSEPERRRLRDRLVYGKMEVIEYDFEALERTLSSSGTGVGLVGDLGVLALTGIAATTGGEATKSALAAASAGIVGAQGSVSKNLYYQRTIPALLAQMEANRAKVRATIVENLIRQTDAAYPLSGAAIDLRRLIRAGSIPASVSEITQQAVEEKTQSEAEVENLRDGSFSSSKSSDALAAWLRPNGKIDADRSAALQDWLNSQPEASQNKIFLGNFIRKSDPVLETLRQRALQDTKLAITQQGENQ